MCHRLLLAPAVQHQERLWSRSSALEGARHFAGPYQLLAGHVQTRLCTRQLESESPYLLTGSIVGLVAAATNQRSRPPVPRRASIWSARPGCFLAGKPSFGLIWIVLAYVLSSMGVYGVCEGWGPEDSVYFSITALTTVGYGDLAPSHPASRLFFSFAILLALVLLAARLSSFVHELVQRETGAAAGRLNQQLKIRLGGASDEDIDIFDEEGERRRLRSRFRRQLQLLTMYLLLSSFISKRALGLPSSWEALYFSVVTLTTIGLGDLVPQTPEAKWIISLLCLVGVPIFGATLAELVALIYGERQRGIKQRLPNLTVARLLKMRKFAEERSWPAAVPQPAPNAANTVAFEELHSRGLLDKKAESEFRKLGEHRISQFEFCCFLLVQTFGQQVLMNEIISMDDVETISKNFLQLDLSGDGALWTKDALAWELQRLLQPKKKKQDKKDQDESDISQAEAVKLRSSLEAVDMKTAGCIELAELEAALQKVGVVTSEEYVRRFFLKLDLNRDGKISFQEYKELIRKLCLKSRPASDEEGGDGPVSLDGGLEILGKADRVQGAARHPVLCFTPSLPG
eukprot:s3228_g6.t1